MLRKENLKQAIDAIAARDAEAGYTLLDLFESGRIDLADPDEAASPTGVYQFRFDRQLVPVKKINLFMQGSAAIEQPLLIHYGELARRLALETGGVKIDFSQADRLIKRAGLLYLLRYEIRLALEQCPKEAGQAKEALAELAELVEAELREGSIGDAIDGQVLFEGAVDADTPAFFTSFPFTVSALAQAADLDLSFFSSRFILNCLVQGGAQNLFTCLENGQINGLVYLRRKSGRLGDSLEIKYIASANDARQSWLEAHTLHRGVGSFLVAGVWLLWKSRMNWAHELTLDAETQAMTFYEGIGFCKTRPYVYVLDRPAGFLLNALVVMADRSRNLPGDVIAEVAGLFQSQIRLLARHKPGHPKRENALAFIKLCLLSRFRPQLAKTAARLLLRYKSRIPEAESLFDIATNHGSLKLIERSPAFTQPLLVFKDDGMLRHLEGIFHLENPNRLKAMDNVLQNPDLDGKWLEVAGREATERELAWVHDADYIAGVAATAKKTLHCFDLDTQTTKGSYGAAKLAVGGVFSLLDRVCAGRPSRGFAAVRPPGHHAEPNKAMGFCLFNNIALGASYLKQNMGLKRILIVDIDAHHGNGTQAAFYRSREVLFISMHQFPCYPGSGSLSEIGQGDGEGYTVNIPLQSGMGDGEFVQVVDRMVRPLAYAYSPQAILVSCGFDLYRQDRLASLNGTPQGYAMLTHLLCHIADEVCNGLIVFVMEGGYSTQGIRECGSSVIRELCDMPSFEMSQLHKQIMGSLPPFASLRKALAIHKRYWPILEG